MGDSLVAGGRAALAGSRANSSARFIDMQAKASTSTAGITRRAQQRQDGGLARRNFMRGKLHWPLPSDFSGRGKPLRKSLGQNARLGHHAVHAGKDDLMESDGDDCDPKTDSGGDQRSADAAGQVDGPWSRTLADNRVESGDQAVDRAQQAEKRPNWAINQT